MIEQSVKPLSKQNTRRESSAEKKKFRSASTNGCGCSKSVSPARHNSKLSEHPPPETCHLNFEKVCERERLRLKLMETRNAAEETSEGVQQFIRHVSSFIEKKNPFKDKVLYSSDKTGKSNPPDDLDTIQFHGTNKATPESAKVKPLSLEEFNEVALTDDKSEGDKQKAQEKLNLPQTAKKKDAGNARGKTSRGSRKSERSSEKAVKGHSPDDKNIPLVLSTRKRGGQSAEEIERRFPNPLTLFPDSAERKRGNLTSVKKKKPSEIPLKKNRAGHNRSRKAASQKVQEPLNFYELYTMNKKFSPLEEIRFCSEIQRALDVACSSEQQHCNGEEQIFKSETTRSKKLETFFKEPGVSTVYSTEIIEDSLEAQQLRIIDLNGMKTTSFTILRTESTLERLHGPNPLNKKMSTLNKCCINTSKTKASVKTLKGKCSKKNVTRSSCKGNKPGLKAKTKRSKKEINLSKKEMLIKNEKSIRECLETGKAWWERRKSGIPLKPEPQKDAGVFHVPVKLVRTRAKSFLRGIEAPKKRERPQTASRMSQVNFEDFQKAETLKPETHTSRNSSRKSRTRENKCNSRGEKEVLISPPPATGNCEQIKESMKTSNEEITFDEKIKMCHSVWSFESNNMALEAKIIEQDSRCSMDVSEVKISDSLKAMFGRDESEDPPKVKRRIRIDLKPTENILKCKTIDNNIESVESFDWLFMNQKSYEDEHCDLPQNKNSEQFDEDLESGRVTEEKVNPSQDPDSSEMAEEPGPLNISISKPQKSCSSLKRRHGEERRLYKSSEGTSKSSRKKKIGSDGGGRHWPPPSGFFSSEISLVGKAATDAKQRSGLTKSNLRDEKKDVFEDIAAVKLKRRNSEPHSLRGYVWKCSDAATTRGHKPSVSSMASSLRHLNTDDIDDFTFWEAVPQRKTAWETSLYHFKRPWSVLSCSVFKDNRRSSTPGIILENLRNGGGFRRYNLSDNERLRGRTENPFDVEPSIAQKNIDIRNWLAALNFPTIPSTSCDFLGESTYGTQSTSEAQNRNKIQTTLRRRKVVSTLKFSEQPAEQRCEENEKRKPPKRSATEGEVSVEPMRMKSGGFIPKEQLQQHQNSEHFIRRPNATPNICSKTVEESFMMEASNRSTPAEPVKSKNVDLGQPQASMSTTVVDARGDQAVEKCVKKDPSDVEMEAKNILSNFLKVEFNRFISGLNLWKYLFMLTIFVATIHFFFLSR